MAASSIAEEIASGAFDDEDPPVYTEAQVDEEIKEFQKAREAADQIKQLDAGELTRLQAPEDAVKGGLLLALRDIDERIRGLTDKISEATDVSKKRADVMRRIRFQELRRILKSADMSGVIQGSSGSQIKEPEPSMGTKTSEAHSDVAPGVLPFSPRDGQVKSDAVLARSNRLSGRKRVTVGCDCCGLGSVWIALLALFAGSPGAQPELTFVSDSNQAVRRYVREQYQPRYVYTNVRTVLIQTRRCRG